MDNLPYERARKDSEGSELFPFSPVNSQDTNHAMSIDTPPASPASDDSHLPVCVDVEHRLAYTLEIIRLIGSGYFGTVIEVKHGIDKRRYAVKCIPLGPDCDTNEIIREPIFHAKFQHMNVVRYYDSWFDDYRIEVIPHAESNDYNDNRLDHYVHLGVRGNSRVRSPRVSGRSNLHLCIRMELCETTLDQIIQMQLLFSQPTKAWNILWQIVKGMAYLHGKDIIHGDLRPVNIFVDDSGCIKIGDFGLSIMKSSSPGLFSQEEDVRDIGLVFTQMFRLCPIDLEMEEIVQPNCAIEYTKPRDFARWLLNPPETRPTCAQLLEHRKLLDQVSGDRICGNRNVNQYKCIHTDAFCNKISITKLDNAFSHSV